MRPARLAAPLFAALALSLAAATGEEKGDAEGYVPMFDGTTLKGWADVNCHPSTFAVRGGEIVTSGKPTGYLRTDKQYENFELQMEWMHENKTEMGNSGLFVWGDPLPAVGTGYTRGIEVQVLVNFDKDWATSHGDLFSIWGAHCTPDRPHPKGQERCLPSERRCKGGGEWNHYKVVGHDGTLKLHVNGKEVSGVSKCTPRKGYLALESEGAVCHFRNLKIKELPSTHPKPEEVADVAQGHKSLFDGLDLDGWKAEKDAWKASNGHLSSAGQSPVSTERSYGAVELIFDWKRPAKAAGGAAVTVGGKEVPLAAKAAPAKPAQSKGWNREVIRVGADGAAVTPGPISFSPGGGLELMNLFVRELK